MRYAEPGKALHQLKARLTKLAFHTQPSLPEEMATAAQDTTVDEVLVSAEGAMVEDCGDKDGGGHRKVFARFGRRRTHNEELCVASCGVILGHATFYGAEGPNSVRVSGSFDAEMRTHSLLFTRTDVLEDLVSDEGIFAFCHVVRQQLPCSRHVKKG